MSARSLPKAPIIAAVVTAGFLFSGLVLLFGCTPERDSRPNIVLVILDTVRRDVTAPGNPPNDFREMTPVFDRLAREGLTFTQAWANAPWTVPSHASIFTGLLPSQHGCTSAQPRLPAYNQTAAEHLAGAGYATAAFYSNPWLADRTTGVLRGFQERIEAPIGRLSQMVSRTGDQGGETTLRNVNQWLTQRSSKAPFFLCVNFLEAHLPYDPPEDFRLARLPNTPVSAKVSIDYGHEYNAGLHADEMVNWELIRMLYAGDVNSADRLLGRLGAMLEGRGLLANTVLIVASDHGESLGEHGLMDHQYSVHEALLAVPLAMIGPVAVVAPGRRTDPVMLSDIYATLLDLAGLAAPAPGADSRSLLGPPADALRPLVAEYSGPGTGLLGLLQRKNPALDPTPLAPARRTVRVGTLRLTLGSDGGVQLHDLSRDPEQMHDLAAARPAEVVRLRAILADPRPAPVADTELDSVTREQLRSLGYIR